MVLEGWRGSLVGWWCWVVEAGAREWRKVLGGGGGRVVESGAVGRGEGRAAWVVSADAYVVEGGGHGGRVGIRWRSMRLTLEGGPGG